MRLDSISFGINHAKRLYPNPGGYALQRRFRFLLRCVWWPGSASRWFRYIEDNPTLRSFSLIEPYIAAKPLSRYMRRNWRVRDRLNCILDHYQLMFSCPKGQAVIATARAEGVIAQLEGKSGAGATYTIVLADCIDNRREGELRIEFRRDGRRINCICGSFRKLDGQMVFVIGTMQGARGEDAKQFVREVTKDLHQLRPRDLLMVALQSVAALFDAGKIMAPTQKHHIFSSRVKANFDSLWTDLGGIMGARGDFELPLQPHYKSLEDIEPKKRAETRRRYALKRQIEQQISETFAETSI